MVQSQGATEVRALSCLTSLALHRQGIIFMNKLIVAKNGALATTVRVSVWAGMDGIFPSKNMVPFGCVKVLKCFEATKRETRTRREK